MDINSLSHTKWNSKYHIAFAPKYRRKIAYGQLKEAEVRPDHVHMLVELPQSISVSSIVGYLKGKSTLMMF